MIRRVITKPLSVKNTSTPIDPPGKASVTVWKRNTNTTAMVRSPSRACFRPEISPFADASGRSSKVRVAPFR
jgi:hypothetical protein